MQLKIPLLRSSGLAVANLLRGFLWRMFGLRPFANLSDQDLADYRWSMQSGLSRAARFQDGEDIDRLGKLHRAIEREMRSRGMF